MCEEGRVCVKRGGCEERSVCVKRVGCVCEEGRVEGHTHLPTNLTYGNKQKHNMVWRKTKVPF